MVATDGITQIDAVTQRSTMPNVSGNGPIKTWKIE